MKMTVEFNSISDMAAFAKFVDQRLAENQKVSEVESLRQQLELAKQQLNRAYTRLRFREDSPFEESADKKMMDSIHNLPIKARTMNGLIAEGCETVGDVMMAYANKRLRKIPNFAKGSFLDLQEALANVYKINIEWSDA